IKADGGTIHSAAVLALHRDGVRVPSSAKLILIVVGDEGGESGGQLAETLRGLGYRVDAIAFLVSVSKVANRGAPLRDCAKALGVPYSEVTVEQFDDPYHVTRVLRALLEAPISASTAKAAPTPGLVEKVMATKLLEV